MLYANPKSPKMWENPTWTGSKATIIDLIDRNYLKIETRKEVKK